MTDTTPSLFAADQTGRRVRLRTLNVLRWAAIAGQIVAIAVSQRVFGPASIELPAALFAQQRPRATRLAGHCQRDAGPPGSIHLAEGVG